MHLEQFEDALVIRILPCHGFSSPAETFEKTRHKVPLCIERNAKRRQRNQRDTPERGFSGNKGMPAISLKRFPG